MTVFSFDQVRDAIRAHAAQEYPRECCGLVVHVPFSQGELRYIPCRNRAAGGEHFILHEEDYARAADDEGDIVAVVHSHPDESANPSMADRHMCERTLLPWIICGWPSGAITITWPSGWRTPLLGREFAHGVLDCYSLVRDYYRLAVCLELPDFERSDEWWLKDPGAELYLRNFAAAGFVEVHDGPRLHDGILMQVLSDQTNHAAVFIGDGAALDALLRSHGEDALPVAGRELMLHHLYGRLSCRDVYGGYWQRHTRKIVRHRSLLDAA